MEEILEISESKNYHTFGVYLGRRKVSNSHKLASLLIQKFALSKKNKDWQPISFEDLKDKGILPCEKHKTYAHWRDDMLKSGLLICMATKEELKENIPNYKANMFKIGSKIEKYIEIAIQENLPKKVDELDTKIDEINQKIETKADLERVEKLESDVNKLKENVKNMATVLLKVLPPDTPIRRGIIDKNINDPEECVKQLALEAKKLEMNIETNNEMFN